MTETPYDSPIRRASSSSWSAIAVRSGQLRAQRQVERHLEHVDGGDLRPALGGEARGDIEGVVRRLTAHDRHQQAAVLEREGRPDRRRAA